MVAVDDRHGCSIFPNDPIDVDVFSPDGPIVGVYRSQHIKAVLCDLF